MNLTHCKGFPSNIGTCMVDFAGAAMPLKFLYSVRDVFLFLLLHQTHQACQSKIQPHSLESHSQQGLNLQLPDMMCPRLELC